MLKRTSLSVFLVLVLSFVLLTSAISAEEVAPLNDRLTSYMARVMETSAIELVQEAKLHYAEQRIEGTEYEGLPLVSQMAPQKAGREDDGGPEFYIDIASGSVTEDDLASLNFFDDDIAYLKLNGEELKEWMEAGMENFNQIDPEKSEDQFLANEDYVDYNFDIFEGVNYVVDVTKPVGERIVEATYEGEPITKEDEFVVVTNQYRSTGGGDFPNAVEDNKILSTEEENRKSVREAIADYLNENDGEAPAPDYNWSLAPVDTEGQILFRSSPDAEDVVDEFEHIEKVGEYSGWGIYSFDLSWTP